MVDPVMSIASDTAVGIISELFKKSLSTFKDAKILIRSKYQKSNSIGMNARNYANQMEIRYNSMRIFGMSEPRPLRNIYVRVNILEKIRARMRISIEELEKAVDCDRLGFGNVLETKAGLNVIDEIEKVIVLGKPGAGKTTFLKYIALMAMDGKLKKNRIPVFVGLKEWSDTKLALLDFIVEQFDICGFPEAKPYIEHVLKQGNCILLLDGFDEITVDLDKAIKEILDFSDKYSKNQFVLSCRIAAFNYVFEKFTEVEMADFDDEQIEAFIKNWFGKDIKTAHECWKKMEENKFIKEIASIPLLLTLLCLAYDENLDFSSNRAELYGDGIDTLLKKWDKSRRIKRQEIYKNLLPDRKKSMLGKIAAKSFQDNHYFLPKRTLENYIADYIQHLPEANIDSLQLDSEAELKAIEAQHGLLVERAKGIYSFSHLTFQEYFTAYYIVENKEKGSFEILANHLNEDKWREVFLLTVGMLPEADDFLLYVRKKIHEFTNQRISLFLDTATQCIKETSNYPPHICKVLSINIVLFIVNSLHLPYTHRRVNDRDQAFDLAHTCELILNLDRNFSSIHSSIINRSHVRAFAFDLANDLDVKLKNNQIEKLVFDFFSDLNKKDISSLYLYIHSTHLLVECLDIGCYISKETRQELLDSLLTETWKEKGVMYDLEKKVNLIFLKHFTLEYWIDDSWYIGRLLEIPGVFSQGKTLNELEDNIIDAFNMMYEEEEYTPQKDIHTKKLGVAV